MNYHTNINYLETNSLRILASKLSSNPYLDICYTSILSICELLSGINDEESFDIRRGIIKKVYASQLPSDNYMPESKLYRAYGIKVKNSISDKIILLGDLCTKSGSYKDYLRDICNSELQEHWAFLKKYDRNSDTYFKKTYKDRQRKFDYSDQNMISGFEDRWNDLIDNNELRERIINDLIVYFAEALLKPNSVISVGDKTLRDLVSAYDRSLDIFFICIGYYSGRKILYKNLPSRNDYIDLNHLMYLPNDSKIIISNDKMLLKLMNKFYPKNILSSKEFTQNLA